MDKGDAPLQRMSTHLTRIKMIELSCFSSLSRHQHAGHGRKLAGAFSDRQRNAALQPGHVRGVPRESDSADDRKGRAPSGRRKYRPPFQFEWYILAWFIVSCVALRFEYRLRSFYQNRILEFGFGFLPEFRNSVSVVLPKVNFGIRFHLLYRKSVSKIDFVSPEVNFEIRFRSFLPKVNFEIRLRSFCQK